MLARTSRMLAFASITLLAATSSRAQPETGLVCETLDDLTLGATATVSQMISLTTINLVFFPFAWNTVETTFEGYATVGNEGLAGGSGLEIFTNNITMLIVPGPNVVFDYLRISYGEHGGNVNVLVNGQLFNTADLTDLDGTMASNVTMTITNTPDGGHGEAEFVGLAQTLGIGGQEFVVDNICFRLAE